MNKKRLYLNSCSFLKMENQGFNMVSNPLLSIFTESGDDDNLTYLASMSGNSNESIYKRTLIDVLKNKFEFVIIGWSHPERSIKVNTDNSIDFTQLKSSSEEKYYRNQYLYDDIVPSCINDKFMRNLKFEPSGTDDTIIYTISLHHFFKSLSIPHLFLNMGKLNSNVLLARENWVQFIDPKNYLSLDLSHTILQKMQFSFVEYYLSLDKRILYKDKEINEFQLNNGSELTNVHKKYTVDIGGHLSYYSYKDILSLMYNHIIHHKLLT